MVTRATQNTNCITSAGTLISDFSALGTSWTRTTSGAGEIQQTNEVPSKYSSTCVRISCSASSSDNGYVTRTLGAAVDLSAYNAIGLAVYVPLDYFTGATAHDMLFFLSSDAGSFTNYFNVTLTARRPGWNFLQVTKSSYTVNAAANWASIRTLRVRMNGSNSAAKRIYLDAIVYNCTGRPKICLTFDDGSSSQYSFAKGELSTYGINGSFFPIAQDPTNFGANGIMTVPQLQEIITAGNESGYHGLHGASSNWMSTSPPLTAIAQSVAAMNAAATWTPVKYAAWPNGEFGQNNSNISTALANSAVYFFGNRTTQDASWAFASLAGAGELQTIPGLSMDNTVTLTQAKQKVDDAISLGEARVFTFHQFAGSAGTVTWAQTDFTELLKYLVLKRGQGLLDVVKFSELIQSCGKDQAWRPPASRL